MWSDVREEIGRWPVVVQYALAVVLVVTALAWVTLAVLFLEAR